MQSPFHPADKTIQSKNSRKRIVIDAGHGGKDAGGRKAFGFKEKELNLQKDSIKAANKIQANDQTTNTNSPATEPATDPSKFTGSWVGQGQDMIVIRYDNGQYFITLDADNDSQPNKTVVKAKEENGKLIVEPGIAYGYNGTSTMTLVGSKKLILKYGRTSYTYERGEL